MAVNCTKQKQAASIMAHNCTKPKHPVLILCRYAFQFCTKGVSILYISVFQFCHFNQDMGCENNNPFPLLMQHSTFF